MDLNSPPRRWYKMFDFYAFIDFDHSIKDACIYFKHLKIVIEYIFSYMWMIC